MTSAGLKQNINTACQHLSGDETIETCNPYHNSIAGPGGEVDVVRVGRDSTISLLYVARHILADALNALASAVGPLNT